MQDQLNKHNNQLNSELQVITEKNVCMPANYIGYFMVKIFFMVQTDLNKQNEELSSELKQLKEKYVSLLFACFKLNKMKAQDM